MSKKSSGNGTKKNPTSSASISTKKPAKIVKERGPKPDYTKRQKVPNVVVYTNPAMVWNGQVGMVNIDGVVVLVATKSTVSGHEIKAVYVLSAPAGSELSAIAGSGVYVTVPSLHFATFVSGLGNDASRKVQERIWEFFHAFFLRTGFKNAILHGYVNLAPANNDKVKTRPSASVDDLISGVPGLYCFERNQPSMLLRVKTLTRAFSCTVEKRDVTLIEVLSVNQKHPLFDYLQSWAYVYHNQLFFGKMPDFKGTRAGEQHKLWEFLTDLIADYRKKVLGSAKPIEVVYNGGEVAEVIYLDDHRRAAA